MKKIPSISEIGKVYGELTVIDIIPSFKGSGAKAKCLCSCGKERIITIGNLRKYKKLCCLDCKKIYEQSEENKQRNRKMMLDLVQSGQYDKSHLKRPRTQEWKDKIAATVSRVNKKGKDSPLYGKSTYILLIEKYGKEEGELRWLQTKEKWSRSLSGEKNYWYGKSVPMGCGYGWKGWYKDFFFRSLRELAYIVNYLEKENLSWVTAESKDIVIEYCKLNNLEYILIDLVKLTDLEIYNLYVNKSIKFMDKYEKMYQERLEKYGLPK